MPQCTFSLILTTVCASAMTALIHPSSVAQSDSNASMPLSDNVVFEGNVAAVVPTGTPRSIELEPLFDADVTVVTPALDVKRLMQVDANMDTSGPMRMGVVQEFLPVDSRFFGEWLQLEDDGWLWIAAFRVTGAKAVRIHIDPWKPPAGAELYVYSPEHPAAVRGPITRTYQPFDELWTPTLYCETVFLEYYIPPDRTPKDADVHLTIDKVLNQYRTGMEAEEPASGGGSTGAPLPCNLDVSCYPAWQSAANGVGALSFIDNQYGFFCSGGMFNRANSADFTPLFTTAFHCGVREWNAPSVLVTWFWQTSSCTGNVPDLNTLPQTQGVTLLVNNNTNDYSLIGLSRSNTTGVTFLGWDASPVDLFTPVTWIHHPRGSWKRITFATNVGTNQNCVSGSGVGWWNLIPDGAGEIEPGSSGSPLFDGAQRVRSVQSCATWGCGSDDSATTGRFDLVFNAFAPFLAPTDPIYINVAWNGTERGTQGQPFNTVIEGIFAVRAGSNMHIVTGTYTEGPKRIDKPMRLNSSGGVVRIQ